MTLKYGVWQNGAFTLEDGANEYWHVGLTQFSSTEWFKLHEELVKPNPELEARLKAFEVDPQAVADALRRPVG